MAVHAARKLKRCEFKIIKSTHMHLDSCSDARQENQYMAAARRVVNGVTVSRRL